MLAACGDDVRTPESLATGLCEATIEWRDDLGELVEQLSRAGVGLDDVAARRQLLLGFVDDAGARKERLLDDAAEAGASGEIAGILRAGARDVADVWRRARAEAEGFPTEDDPEPFHSRGLQLANYVEETGSAWKSAIAEVHAAASPALAAALDAEPACSVIPRTADR